MGLRFHLCNDSQARRGHSPQAAQAPLLNLLGLLFSCQGPTGPLRPRFSPEAPGTPVLQASCLPLLSRGGRTVVRQPPLSSPLFRTRAESGNASLFSKHGPMPLFCAPPEGAVQVKALVPFHRCGEKGPERLRGWPRAK